MAVEGDVAHEADLARAKFGITSANLTGCVLSDSVDYLKDAQEKGSLPTVQDCPAKRAKG